MDDREDFHPIPGDPSSSSGGGGGRFHIPQPGRDLQSNWELDVAKNLEDYLLGICSGEPSSCAINFAEAALLLQGSVQVYSRKVEYLYSLVLHALEFLSQKRQDQQENSSIQPDGTISDAVADDEHENFLGLDDVPVEAKNCLDNDNDKDRISNHFVKPPANLLVLEGDCLDTSGDTGELESYLLATCNFYRDFLLVDPCDAGAVFNFIESNAVGKEQPQVHKGSSVRSKNRHNVFTSPTGRSRGSAHKSVGRREEVNPNGTSENNRNCEVNNHNPWPDSHFNHDYREDDMFHVEEPNVGYDRDDSDDDSEDPWKPLNPHEPGSLKIKPFKKSKSVGRQVLQISKQNTVTSQFPIAKLEGFISPDLAESEVQRQRHLKDNKDTSHSPPYFEKLRRSFSNGEREAFDVFGGLEDENDDNEDVNGHPDSHEAGFDLPDNTYDVDMEFHRGKFGDAGSNFDGTDTVPQDNLDSQASLEDLCRSHLDALLASISETEKQTELASLVSTWKQRIEKTLEEQDSCPPFDIHQYGDRILEKLSMEADSGGSLSFTDVVIGQPKHDIARTFSALLQLVNNGSVDLQRPASSNSLVCYSAAKPFYVKLLRDERRKKMEMCLSRKRVKSPSNGQNSKTNYPASEVISPPKSLHQNVRSPVRIGKGTVIRCSPEGKRRRRSRVTVNGD